MKAEINLSYKNEREAEAVAKAVSPDNVKVPSGLSVKTVRRKSRVFTTVKCQTRLPTFIATLDDLLSCISVAEKAYSVAKEFEMRRSGLES
ncbi:MAG: KEOPS complex subunit Pcc1 [Candidatus Bathyarchaeota archaeon]|nr:KEOPS complex subunit Pcc1 [Candidatus Bathyarchaeota archaeon]